MAVREFIVGPLSDDPHRVGKRLRSPLEDRHTARRGTYRVIFRIDDVERLVTVVDVAHRRDAYRRGWCRRRSDPGAGRWSAV